MYLTTVNLTDYLLSRGLVEHKSIIDGGLRITELECRHRSFFVRQSHGQQLFVKQIKSVNDQTLQGFEAESNCYQFAATTPAFGSLAELIPPFIRYDHRRFVLVLEYLVGSRDLVTYHRTQGLMPTEVAQEFGQKLAEVHTAGRQATAETLSAVSPPERIPWIFSIHRGDYVLSRANRQLIDLALKNEAFSLQLDELHQNWRQDTLLHGDVKWLNCLLHEAKGKTNIYLIDWEMLQLGESLWDVAGFIQSYLSEWTLQPNKERELTLDQWIERYADAIRIQHDSIHSFWSAYAQTAGLDTALTGSDFQRTLLYVAGRLFQTVYEYLSQQETLFPEAIRTLELAQRLLAKDADTIELTLGVAQ